MSKIGCASWKEIFRENGSISHEDVLAALSGERRLADPPLPLVSSFAVGEYPRNSSLPIVQVISTEAATYHMSQWAKGRERFSIVWDWRWWDAIQELICIYYLTTFGKFDGSDVSSPAQQRSMRVISRFVLEHLHPKNNIWRQSSSLDVTDFVNEILKAAKATVRDKLDPGSYSSDSLRFRAETTIWYVKQFFLDHELVHFRQRRRTRRTDNVLNIAERFVDQFASNNVLVRNQFGHRGWAWLTEIDGLIAVDALDRVKRPGHREEVIADLTAAGTCTTLMIQLHLDVDEHERIERRALLFESIWLGITCTLFLCGLKWELRRLLRNKTTGYEVSSEETDLGVRRTFVNLFIWWLIEGNILSDGDGRAALRTREGLVTHQALYIVEQRVQRFLTYLAQYGKLVGNTVDAAIKSRHGGLGRVMSPDKSDEILELTRFYEFAPGPPPEFS